MICSKKTWHDLSTEIGLVTSKDFSSFARFNGRPHLGMFGESGTTTSPLSRRNAFAGGEPWVELVKTTSHTLSKQIHSKSVHPFVGRLALQFLTRNLQQLQGDMTYIDVNKLVKDVNVWMFRQVPFLTTMLCVHRPNLSLAISLVFLQGLASSGSLIFICFNFMMSIKADVSHAAYRMGILEMTRQAVTWFITAYIFLGSPSAKVCGAQRQRKKERQKYGE